MVSAGPPSRSDGRGDGELQARSAKLVEETSGKSAILVYNLEGHAINLNSP